jgi:serine protease Do
MFEQHPSVEERPSPWRGIAGLLALAVVVGALGGAFAGASVALLVPRETKPAKPAAAAADVAGAPNLLQVREESSITETFKKVSPGVVTLTVQAQRTDQVGRTIRETNLGSGVIIDPRGYLITNEHVVRGATKIVVTLADGEERPGVLVGDDAPFTDLALVRIQPDGLSVVPMGDSDALAPGQAVLAIGSVAFSPTASDFRSNITRGIVSGTHRRWPRDDVVMEDLIQTDAAINHGNSGGALVTMTGELVGITTTVVRGTQAGQQVEGVAFALSSRTFKPIVDQLIRSGKTERPYVGIIHRQITPELAQQARLSVQEGAVVLDVVADSPAAKAGIQKGDVITRLADQDISSDYPYLNALAKQRPNSTVLLTLLRSGRELKLNLDVGAR